MCSEVMELVAVDVKIIVVTKTPAIPIITHENDCILSGHFKFTGKIPGIINIVSDHAALRSGSSQLTTRRFNLFS